MYTSEKQGEFVVASDFIAQRIRYRAKDDDASYTFQQFMYIVHCTGTAFNQTHKRVRAKKI